MTTELCTIAGVVNEIHNVRSNKDSRKKVDRFVAAYFGQKTGFEYRVSLECERNSYVSFPDFIEKEVQ